MPNGFPAFPKNSMSTHESLTRSPDSNTEAAFPNDEPPTLFHPASPKMKPLKRPIDDVDKASISTTSTFSSKIGLLKDNVKSRIPAPYKAYRNRKEAAAHSKVVLEKDQKLPANTQTRKSLSDCDGECRFGTTRDASR